LNYYYLFLFILSKNESKPSFFKMKVEEKKNEMRNNKIGKTRKKKKKSLGQIFFQNIFNF